MIARAAIALFLAALLGATPLRSAPELRTAAVAASAFTSDRLMAELTRELTGHFRIEGDLQLELIRPWTAPEKTAAAWDLAVLDTPPVPTSTLVVHYRLVGDGAVVADETLVLRASVWRDVWFTRQPAASGSPFDPSALDSRRVDCLRERDALPATAGDRSFMFARDVGADRMLTWHDVARRPLVRKGEVVEVVAAEGPLLVTLKALALQNGGQGDLVTVRNLESRKDIPALVVADDRVRVQF